MNAPVSLAERLRGFEPKSGTKLSKAFRRDGVRDSQELRRILDLPRRKHVLPTDTRELSEALASEGGEYTLRPIQAFALEEAYRVGGLVASIRVGGGKTAVTFLLSFATESPRPLLLVPAELGEKTRNDFRALAKHFDVPADRVPRVMSYELLGREQSAGELERYAPGVIVADEGQFLKNPKAAVTRRVRRYLDAHPECRFMILSGSLTTRSLGECAHLYDWALRERSPLPRAHTTVVEWGLAIDENLAVPTSRMDAGKLCLFMDAEDRQLHRSDPIAATRQAVRKRIHDTAGVVATTDDGPGMALLVHLHLLEQYSTETEEAFTRLHALWETPGGETFDSAVEKWRHECELACGFYYRWKTEPPREWLARRRTWHQIVRHIIDHNRRQIDSPAQVEHAVARGDYDGETANANGMVIGACTIDEALRRWREVENDYERETISVWLDDRMATFARAWLAKGPGLVWVSHIAVGERLSRVLGLPYYAAGGRADGGKGALIDHAAPGSSGIASIHSCRRGRNLQGIWSRNLFLVDSIGAEAWEQALGRTHRDGQQAGVVTADVAIGCLAQWDGFEKALEQARYAHSVTGQPQKLGLCDLIRPSVLPVGPRWT